MTVKRDKNQARIILTFEVELSKEEMAKSAPHLTDATDILRALAISEDWKSDFEVDAEKISNDDMKVTSVKLEVIK